MLVVISISCPYQRAAVSALREATNNFSILAVTRRWSYQWTFFFALQFVGAWNFEPCQFSAVSRHIWKALQMDWDFHNSGTVNSYNHQPTFNGQLFPFQHSWKFSAMHGPSRHLHRCFSIPPPYQFWSWDPLFPGDTFGHVRPVGPETPATYKIKIPRKPNSGNMCLNNCNMVLI